MACQQWKILFHELGHLNVHACILCLTYLPPAKILNYAGNIWHTSNTSICSTVRTHIDKDSISPTPWKKVKLYQYPETCKLHINNTNTGTLVYPPKWKDYLTNKQAQRYKTNFPTWKDFSIMHMMFLLWPLICLYESVNGLMQEQLPSLIPPPP